MDIGLDKNGFLHADDVVFPGVEVARRGRGGRGAGKGKRITELLKPGQEILVQAIKDPLKTKGPRLSMQLSIAGRYLVYVPQGEGVGVSRRLEDKERDRLRRAAQKIDFGEGGVIIRTAAQGATREDFEREIKYLHKLHDVLQQRAKETPAPAMVFQEADLSVRVARDIFSGEFEKAIVDDEKQHHRLESFFNRTAPELLERLELYDDKDEPLFEKYGVEDAIQSVLKRRVDLPSGGYLMIDYAEAMTVIDVNSGSFTGRGKGAKLEDTITRTNLEAAEEVVSQLRLRDIGGIIVIDFIDMARARNRDTVLKTLRKSLDEDRTKTYVVEISPLGLVEMTRQNVTDGVREIMTKPCPVCEGEGVVLSEETVAIEVDRWLRDLVAERQGAGVPDPGAPEGRVDPGRRPRRRGPDPRDRAGDRHATSTSRAPRRCRSTTSRWCSRARPTRSRSARSRSARARRCSSTSRSRTCTTRTTPWPSWTATWCRSSGGPAGGREDARADREGGPKRGPGLAREPARGHQRGRGSGSVASADSNGRRRREPAAAAAGEKAETGAGARPRAAAARPRAAAREDPVRTLQARRSSDPGGRRPCARRTPPRSARRSGLPPGRRAGPGCGGPGRLPGREKAALIATRRRRSSE